MLCLGFYFARVCLSLINIYFDLFLSVDIGLWLYFARKSSRFFGLTLYSDLLVTITEKYFPKVSFSVFFTFIVDNNISLYYI